MTFVKGHDPKRNYEGRPKGTYSLVTILKKKLAEAVEKGGKELGEELVEIWLEQAKSKKDFKALEKIVQYIDGMPKQEHKIEAEIRQEFKQEQINEIARRITDGQTPS